MQDTQTAVQPSTKVLTTEEYWDCECPHAFIHHRSEASCPKCGAVAQEQPDSHVSEVELMLAEKAAIPVLDPIIDQVAERGWKGARYASALTAATKVLNGETLDEHDLELYPLDQTLRTLDDMIGDAVSSEFIGDEVTEALRKARFAFARYVEVELRSFAETWLEEHENSADGIGNVEYEGIDHLTHGWANCLTGGWDIQMMINDIDEIVRQFMAFKADVAKRFGVELPARSPRLYPQPEQPERKPKLSVDRAFLASVLDKLDIANEIVDPYEDGTSFCGETADALRQILGQ